MDHVELWHASSDAACIVYQISTRLDYNQTEIYPDFEWALGSEPRPGYVAGNLFQNGLTQAQNAGGALQYVNEVLVRSDEPFVRLFPGHFSSIAPAQHGLPLRSAAADSVGGGGGGGDCDLAGDWYDLSPNGPHPKPFNLHRTGPTTFAVPEPNEWGCPVNATYSRISGHPGTEPAPRLAGHPECGLAGPRTPPVPPHAQLSFLWPAHGESNSTVQNLTVTDGCDYLCFPPKYVTSQGPYGRRPAKVPAGTCAGGGGGASPSGGSPFMIRYYEQ